MRLSGLAALALVAGLAIEGCKDDDIDVDVREGPSGMLADSTVLQAMRSTDSLGRIIYDPAPDLSLTSAQQRRPEIFRPPSAPAARPAAPKDTTRPAGATPRARP
jgi:hypothetical protein